MVMLVLTRKIDESIIIGDNIEIKVVEVKGDTVRLGVSAPKEVRIHRREVYEAILKENLAAAQSGKTDLTRLASALKNLKETRKK